MGPRRHSGFSLIEVMISILIVGILIVAAIPSFSTWMQNSQIRTASESMANALQTARNEAIRRNACVQAKLVDYPKTSWDVRLCSLAEDASVPPIAQRNHAEGSLNASLEVLPSDATIVSFNALGRVVDPNPSNGSAALQEINIRNSVMAAAEERKLRIEIPPGGGARMCDPNKAIGATDPRHCEKPDT
jgi:type IV fimbrial biogenesis protein FimT